MRFSTVLLRIVRRKEEIFREYGRMLKEAFREVLGDGGVRVIIFGSVVRGNYSPLSDLDVLVVSRSRGGEVRGGRGEGGRKAGGEAGGGGVPPGHSRGLRGVVQEVPGRV